MTDPRVTSRLVRVVAEALRESFEKWGAYSDPRHHAESVVAAVLSEIGSGPTRDAMVEAGAAWLLPNIGRECPTYQRAGSCATCNPMAEEEAASFIDAALAVLETEES
jgi:hypothetical protein